MQKTILDKGSTPLYLGTSQLTLLPGNFKTSIITGLMLLICGCTPKVLMNQNPCPMAGPDDKAHCVVISCDGNFDEFVPIYIDNHISSGLKEKSITSFDVTPGIHYIIAELDNTAIKKIKFVAGKAYYFKLGTLEVPMFDGVRMDLITKDEADFLIKLHSEVLQHTRLNPAYTYTDLKSADYAEELREYKVWADENPADTLVYFNYYGY